MCLFPLPNLQFNSVQYRKGVTEFDCGACPECLRKRSNVWALRAVYESKMHAHNCMITLTYDNFKRDEFGNIMYDARHIPIELPVNPDLKVNQRDVQLFIKRLRKWYCRPLKYIACAEYGSRTHRAHYHLILFGVKFDDAHFYKKSKRGNPIYMSSALTRLWSHGICTIDSIRVHSAVARYCTKYCAKSRSDKTFMLASQRIGFDALLRDFNGLNYMIEGREYPVPRFIWQHYIMSKYKSLYPRMDFRYVNRDYNLDYHLDYSYHFSKCCRRLYMRVRDSDPLYVRYLDYWSSRSSCFERNKLSVLSRIYLLDDRKYHFYKVSALDCYSKRSRFVPYPAPGSNCTSAFGRYLCKFAPFAYLASLKKSSLAVYPSCPNTASDTNPSVNFDYYPFFPTSSALLRKISDDPPNFFLCKLHKYSNSFQLSLDFLNV